jgi:hypothetical protein
MQMHLRSQPRAVGARHGRPMVSQPRASPVTSNTATAYVTADALVDEVLELIKDSGVVHIAWRGAVHTAFCSSLLSLLPGRLHPHMQTVVSDCRRLRKRVWMSLLRSSRCVCHYTAPPNPLINIAAKHAYLAPWPCTRRLWGERSSHAQTSVRCCGATTTWLTPPFARPTSAANVSAFRQGHKAWVGV